MLAVLPLRHQVADGHLWTRIRPVCEHTLKCPWEDTNGHPSRHLSGEGAAEYHARVSEERSVDDLIELAAVIIPYFMQHNAEADACDLLMEVCKRTLVFNFVIVATLATD